MMANEAPTTLQTSKSGDEIVKDKDGNVISINGKYVGKKKETPKMSVTPQSKKT